MERVLGQTQPNLGQAQLDMTSPPVVRTYLRGVDLKFGRMPIQTLLNRTTDIVPLKLVTPLADTVVVMAMPNGDSRDTPVAAMAIIPPRKITARTMLSIIKANMLNRLVHRHTNRLTLTSQQFQTHVSIRQYARFLRFTNQNHLLTDRDRALGVLAGIDHLRFFRSLTEIHTHLTTDLIDCFLA